MLSGCQSILDCHNLQSNFFTTHELNLCFYNIVALSVFIIQELLHQARVPPALEPPGHSTPSLLLLSLSRASYSNWNGHSHYSSFLFGSLIIRADLVVSNMLYYLLRALVGNLHFLGNDNGPRRYFSLFPLHLFLAVCIWIHIQRTDRLSNTYEIQMLPVFLTLFCTTWLQYLTVPSSVLRQKIHVFLLIND